MHRSDNGLRADLRDESANLEQFRHILAQRRDELEAEHARQLELARALEARNAELERSTAELERLESELIARGEAYNAERAAFVAELDEYRRSREEMYEQVRAELEEYRATLEARRGELESQYRDLTSARSHLISVHASLERFSEQSDDVVDLIDRSRLELGADDVAVQESPALGTGA